MRQRRLSNWLSRWQSTSRTRRGRPQEQEPGSCSNATSLEAPTPAAVAPSSAADRSDVAETSPTAAAAASQASGPLQPGESAATPLEQRLSTALSAVWSELQSRAGSTDFVTLLQQVFGPGRESTAQALADRLASGDQLGLHVELLSGSVMGSAAGAYAAAGPDGQPTIYINVDWLKGASDEQLHLVLLEEISHGFDTVLNGGVDTAGDEGELLAKLFSGDALSATQAASILADQDSGSLVINGNSVATEFNITATGISSTTLGATTSTQTINRATAESLSVTVTYDASNSRGADILIAAYNGTTLIGWTVYNRTTNLDAGTGGATATLTLSFNLAQFDPSFSTNGLNLRAWQGTAGGATNVGTANDTAPAITSGTSSTAIPFAANTTSASTSDIAIPSSGGGSVTWSNTSVDALAPTLAITTPISSDGFVNNAEDESALSIAGTSSGADGRTVTVNVGGTTKTATIATGGTWSISLSSAELKALAEGTVNITANVSDAAGNAATQATASFSYDRTPPTLAITTPISSDGFVNNAEDESALSIAGTSSGADGRTVTVNVGGTTKTTTIATGGAWSISLSSAELKALAEGNVNITANVSDAAGNAATQATASFSYDRTPPTLAITTPISSDGFVNNAEDESALSIAGTSSGADGRTVTVNVGGTTKTATIATGGTWSISLSSAELKALAEGTVNITANVSDAAGNAATQATASFSYDRTPPTLAITTPISSDGFVNNAEDESALSIAGTSSGADGRTVTVNVGGTTKTTTIATGGAWSISLSSAELKALAEGNVNITANVSDAAGNAATQATASFSYDRTPPTLAITTPISSDGFVNNAEDESALSIAGTSSGADGRTVTVNVGGTTKTATIATGGAWSISLSSAELKALAEGNVNITANVSDAAGNAATQATASFSYDRTPPTLAITTPISSDGFVNNAEDESALSIAGTSSGADGRTVTVNVGGTTKTATIATGGTWSISLSSAELKALAEGTVNITANVSDAAGNAATQATASFSYDRTPPTLAITTPISSDGFVNNAEDESALSIAGTSSGADGRTVTVNVGGTTKTATIATGGTWSISLSSAELKALAEGTVNITANVSDAAGNAATQATASFSYDRTPPTLAITTPISSDGFVNNAEDESALSIAGTSSGADGRTVTVNVGGTTKTTTIATGGAWSISLSSAELKALAEGNVNITANVSDAAGNAATQATASFSYDRTPPSAPSIAWAVDNVGSIQGPLSFGDSTDDSNLTVRINLTGTGASSGDSIQLHNGVSVLGSAYAITALDIANGFADVATGTLSNGVTYQIAAKVVDAAGNASTPSSALTVTVDTAAPTAPTLALGTGVANGATAAEASQLSGVVTLTAENQSTVAVTFSRSGGGTVTRTLIGNGTAQALSLSAEEVASLGDGLISASATATDAAGNSSGASSTSFTLDTSAPSALGLTPPADNGVNTNDGITSLNTFTINALETGAIWQFSTNGGTTWSAGSGTTFTAPDGSYGAGDIQVRQIDLAGNAGPISTNSSAITINANGAGPIITAISPGIAQTATPLNTGIVISFSEAIYANGGTLTIQNGNGANNNLYRMTLTSSQSSGSFSLGSGTWFIAGNKLYIDPDSNFSSNLTVNIDISGSALVNASGIGNATITSNNNSNYRFTTGPTGTLDSQAPGTTVTSLALSADSVGEGTAGTSSDFITRTAQQTISGTLSSTLAADELVQVSLDNGVTWRFADASAGNAFELSGGVLTGSNTLQARVIDGAGNAGTSRTQAYVLDTTAPDSVALALQADTGSSLRDGITSNANVLVSQLATDTSWQVSTNGGGSWSTGSGSGFNLAPGSYNAGQVQVRQIDLAGNVSAVAANNQAWIVDTTAPQFLSSGVAAAINENSGANQLIYTPQMAATEALTGGVLRYAISGGDAGAFSIGTFNGAVRLLANSDYETKSNYSFTLTTTDVAGNASSQTVSLAIADLDEMAPNAPQINVVASDDRINAREAGATVVVSGRAEVGSTVRVNWGANPARSTTATDGLWSVSFSSIEVPANGNSSITATATDAAGNVSSLGSGTVVVDRVTPNRPVLNTVAGDNRINSAEAAAGIVLSGTAEAGSLISASLAGVSRTATAAANGTWTLNYASAQLPADGWASLTVTSSDAAGNVSSAATRQLLVDTTAPQTLSLQAVAGDNRINAAEAAAGIQLSGATEAGAVVQVQWGGSVVGTALANVQGLWALNLASAALPADGDRNLLINASDAVGNVSAALSRSINLDRLAPSTPTINSVGNGDVVNALIAAAGVVVNGTAETGSQISVQWGGLLRTTSTDASGNWGLLYGTGQLPTEGVTVISVSSRDSGGNVSSLGSRSVLLDTTPSLTAVSSLRLSADTGTNNNDFITSVAQQTLSGTLSASLQSGETVQISLDGGSQWSSATTEADLKSFSLPINLSASGTIQARVLDGTGNAGAVTTQAYRLNSSASGNGVSSLAISADSGVQGDLLTNVSLQTIRGQLNASLQAGESVQFRRQLSDGSWSNWGTATSSLNSQAFLFSTSLREGANGFDVRYVDSAGNGGQASNLSVILDSTAPQVNAITVNGAGLNRNWQAGDEATVQVGFSEAVHVTGTPSLKIMVGGQDVPATYADMSGLDLSFITTISADTAATNPIINIVPGSLDLFNATISDAAGNNALVAISNQLIGSGGNDVISGSAQIDAITGAAGADQLSGGGSADLFIYRSATDSNLGSNGLGYDRIIDFQLGVDQLQLGNQNPTRTFTSMGSINELSASAISDLLTSTSFANPGFSATFQVGLDIFLVINDDNAGFSEADDLLVAIGSQASGSI